ncbi:hypothetical protein [Pseudochelatococcus contaminans]|uniref:hypothetical protein n=1 Tax=Pseudochelatococcus contaminans TaxID=1538103 RepID=UPI00160ECF6B|nr:hypothetical protein [Pseudochelatococcus contaminans]
MNLLPFPAVSRHLPRQNLASRASNVTITAWLLVNSGRNSIFATRMKHMPPASSITVDQTGVAPDNSGIDGEVCYSAAQAIFP